MSPFLEVEETEIGQYYSALLKDPFNDDLKRILADLYAQDGQHRRADMINSRSGVQFVGFTGQGLIFDYPENDNDENPEKIVFAEPMPNVAFSMTDGFVTKCLVSSKDWFGEFCFACRGRGFVYNQGALRYLTCLTCFGSGRVKTKAREILNLYPITEVSFSDLIFVSADRTATIKSCFEDPSSFPWITLPDPLRTLDEFKQKRYRICNTSFDLEAIRRVGLRYGRKFACLPPIKFPPIG